MENPNKNRPIQALCAGEALIDMVCNPDGMLTPCSGGAVYNLARALAMQGVETAYLNPFSMDIYGQNLRAGIEQAGVRVLNAASVKEPTSLAVVNIDNTGKAAYSFYREGIADRQINAAMLIAQSAMTEAQIVCTGCLALSPDDANVYLPWLVEQKQLGRTICIDMNVRAAVMKDQMVYKDNIHQALQYADIIKASDDDLAYLETNALEIIAKTSAHIFLLTLGAEGAQAFTNNGKHVAVSAPQNIQVVDTVGAGDCFFAGFLAYWLRMEGDLQAALQHAVMCASISVSRQGCQPPHWNDVVKRLTI